MEAKLIMLPISGKDLKFAFVKPPVHDGQNIRETDSKNSSKARRREGPATPKLV
jgi:hypothetical protein